MNADTVGLRAGWARTVRYVEQASQRFWLMVDDRCPALLPERDAGMWFTGLGRLAVGGDDPAGRAAALLVLGRAHRSLGLLPAHHALLGEALIATVARYCGRSWRAEQAAGWERAVESAARAVIRAAMLVGDGPARWPFEVVGLTRITGSIGVLAVRPVWRRVPYRPGQALPVNSPRRPGRWRWYSPANAARADGTVEFHLRAVPGGSLSGALLRTVRPGELLFLGPAAGHRLLLDPASSGRDLLLIAGGTGLAPLRALVEQIASRGAGGRRVTLVVGARRLDDIYDPVTLDKLQCAYDWLTVVPALSEHPAVPDAEHGDALTVGLWFHQPGQDVYVCGPPAMITEARRRLPAAGIPPERLHLPDSFPSPASSLSPSLEGAGGDLPQP